MTSSRSSRLGILAVIVGALAACTPDGPSAPRPVPRAAAASLALASQFTTIDPDSSTFTELWSINAAGTMVGVYFTGGQLVRSSAFIRAGSHTTSFVYPGSDVTITSARGIDSAGVVVGFYQDGVGRHGYIRTPAGAFHPLNFPGATTTEALGISETGGVIVGSFRYPGETVSHGYVWEAGAYAQRDVPNAQETIARGVSVPGIVGRFTSHSAVHGFLWAGENPIQLDVPGAVTTICEGINPQGVIVGRYGVDQSANTHAFVWHHGAFDTFDYPHAQSTQASGINAGGWIVGSYTAANGSRHGFLRAP